MKKCEWCCKVLTQVRNKYCDKICYRLHIDAINLKKFYEGSIKDNKTLKKFLILDRGEVCELCGQPPVWNSKPLSLQVDHVNGNSDINKPKNLRLLCPNCHTQTETFSNSKGIRKETKRNKYLRKYKGY